MSDGINQHRDDERRAERENPLYQHAKHMEKLACWEADDGEAVWSEVGVKWMEQHCNDQYGKLAYQFNAGGNNVDVSYYDDRAMITVHSRVTRTIDTLGQLRRLLAALGWQKESHAQ